MKKLVLISVAIFSASGSFAQNSRFNTPPSTPDAQIAVSAFPAGTELKGAGLSDTLYYTYSGQTAGPFNFYHDDYTAPLDSGYYYGISAENSKAYAQLYRYSSIDASAPSDTTYNVYGLISRWAGSRSANSTRSVSMNIWARGTTKSAITGRNKFFIYGVPVATTVASKSVLLTSLALTGGTTVTFFTAPLTGVNYDIYAGSSITYTYGNTAGDTVGLGTSASTSGGTYKIETGTLDTLVSANTLIQNSAGVWKATNFEPGYFAGGNIIVYPIIKLSCPTCHPSSVNGIIKNGLTFFGNYPNPAVASTNIHLALKSGADVTISVMDATGKTVSVSKHSSLAAGEHTLTLDTDLLAAGNYVYLIETSTGDGIASLFTVAK